MDDEAYEAAVLSKSAYDHLREGPEVTQAELLEYGLAGYKLDPEFSDDDSVTIVRPDGSVVIAHRGTDSVRDVLPDAAILFGRHAAAVGLPFVDDRFDLASRKYERVRAAFPGADISTVGHSLGGTLADHVGRKHGIKSLAFNPGSTPHAEAMRYVFGGGGGRVYSTGSDPISYSAYLFGSDVVRVPPAPDGDWLSHGLNHFLPARRTSSEPPEYLLPVSTLSGERVPYCVAHPELCPSGRRGEKTLDE